MINAGAVRSQLLKELEANGTGTDPLQRTSGFDEPVCSVVAAPEGTVVVYLGRSNGLFTLSARLPKKSSRTTLVVSAGEKPARIKNRKALQLFSDLISTLEHSPVRTHVLDPEALNMPP